MFSTSASMELDHYYTQRDPISNPGQVFSAPSTPSRAPGLGRIRIPARRNNPELHREIFGSDDEYEDGQIDDKTQRFLDSLDLSHHSMTIPIPGPRKIAGTKRVVSAQTAKRMREQAGWKVGAEALNATSFYVNPVPPSSPLVFQSITATPHLSERSFEELRAECYGQSYIATGAPPPPSVPPSVDMSGIWQQAHCIPPTFQPSVVPDPLGQMTDAEMFDV
ncbi:hypothetical protein GYMLUDRAFT_39675 [Collybiopsis luxurians FD-317 M1]|nr:hypothetical protein GYMLUDRAFT_39675 [Collybiopsis luxurians FD-317 M1]